VAKCVHNEGRTRSWTNLRCYPGICLDILSKITKTLDRRASTRVEVRGRDREVTIAVPETVQCHPNLPIKKKTCCTIRRYEMEHLYKHFVKIMKSRQCVHASTNEMAGTDIRGLDNKTKVTGWQLKSKREVCDYIKLANSSSLPTKVLCLIYAPYWALHTEKAGDASRVILAINDLT